MILSDIPHARYRKITPRDYDCLPIACQNFRGQSPAQPRAGAPVRRCLDDTIRSRSGDPARPRSEFDGTKAVNGPQKLLCATSRAVPACMASISVKQVSPRGCRQARPVYPERHAQFSARSCGGASVARAVGTTTAVVSTARAEPWIAGFLFVCHVRNGLYDLYTVASCPDGEVEAALVLFDIGRASSQRPSW
jgi:hypothetical protein